MSVDIYALNLFIEQTDENRIFFVRSPHHKHFGKAQHLVLCTSVVLYLLSRAALMSPGKDETRVCGYILTYIITES